MAGDVGGEAEMDQRQPLGCATLDLLDRRVPRLDVDVRRRRDREDVLGRLDPDAAGIACEQRAVPQVADVM